MSSDELTDFPPEPLIRPLDDLAAQCGERPAVRGGLLPQVKTVIKRIKAMKDVA